MKNYAGNRLSPWLGHLMVSRQETDVGPNAVNARV